METGLKKCAISGFGHASFPEDGTFHERLAETLFAISKEMDLKDCVCAMSVPSDRFFYRNVSVPFSETKKIQQMLPYELESEIPFSVDNLLIDFNKVPLPGKEGDTRIIAAGIETERLKNILDAVESCGIAPQVLFPVGYSMSAWLCSKDFPDETFLFTDFDGEICSLYLMISGELSLIRSFHLPPGQANSAIHLWGHIQRSIAGFESLFETKISPATIVINGFQDEKFPKQLETVSSVSVKTLQVQLPDTCEPPEGDAKKVFSPLPCYNGALSCALYMLDGFKGMNFRKGPLAARNQLLEYRERLIRTAVIAGIVFVVWIAGGVIGNFMTQRKVDRIDARIKTVFTETFPDIKVIVNAVHQMGAEIETLKKAAYGSKDTASQVRSIDLLRDISRNIPSNLDVIFTKYRLSEDGIYIEGTTSSFDEVEVIKTKLESIEDVVSVSTPTNTRDGSRIRFKMRIETSREESQ
jgi:type II secretory pathway component PulL